MAGDVTGFTIRQWWEFSLAQKQAGAGGMSLDYFVGFSHCAAMTGLITADEWRVVQEGFPVVLVED